MTGPYVVFTMTVSNPVAATEENGCDEQTLKSRIRLCEPSRFQYIMGTPSVRAKIMTLMMPTRALPTLDSNINEPEAASKTAARRHAMRMTVRVAHKTKTILFCRRGSRSTHQAHMSKLVLASMRYAIARTIGANTHPLHGLFLGT